MGAADYGRFFSRVSTSMVDLSATCCVTGGMFDASPDFFLVGLDAILEALDGLAEVGTDIAQLLGAERPASRRPARSPSAKCSIEPIVFSLWAQTPDLA
jgi:hypothetical protein